MIVVLKNTLVPHALELNNSKHTSAVLCIRDRERTAGYLSVTSPRMLALAGYRW